MRTSLTKSTSGLSFSMKARSSLRLESTLDSSEFAFHTTTVLGSSGGTSSVVFWRFASLFAPPGREKNCVMLIDAAGTREVRHRDRRAEVATTARANFAQGANSANVQIQDVIEHTYKLMPSFTRDQRVTSPAPQPTRS